ncbi:MAG TPA: hypothetical protein VKB12_08985, partial [Pyrinomonadaceae bacterium]|nr:hypothetical protein [Pyrinomonadaceae bacterium]
GDVTGPVNSTTVTSIRNREVLATAPNENQVLTFAGGKWRAADPPAGTGTAPKPATTVTAETSFGLTANGGTSVDYARADHTHGTPPAPVPVLNGDVTGAAGATKVAAIQNVAVDVTKPTTTGQLLGFDAALNRWKPVSPPAASAPNLAGDVTGSTGATTVIALRNTPVDATKPTTGQFLGFDVATNSWKPLAPPSGTATSAVTRSTSLPYGIVAAGLLPAAKGTAGNSYNNLRVTSVSDGIVTMVFDNYQPPPPSSPTQMYIVKVLPVLTGGVALNDLTVAFGGFGDNVTGFTLIVNNAGQRVPAAALAFVSFMVEVSQFDMKTLTINTTKTTKDTKETETKLTKETETKTTKDLDKVIKDSDISSFAPAGASPSFSGAGTEAGDGGGDAASEGRAFIVGDERPEVGRAAFDLADKQDDKLPETGAGGKQAEAFN